MLALLSPAKSLDLEKALPTRKRSQPRLLDEASRLVEVMRGKAPSEVAELMSLSDELAELNVERYAAWTTEHTPRDSRPAALLFDGDVYRGMAARERFAERDWTEAQKTVRILSGLYGVLRPLDLTQAYRLEMGTRLRTERGDGLYDFWGDTVTDLVAADLAASPGPDVVIDLASREYSAVVRQDRLDARVVTPRFLDPDRSGTLRVISFPFKRARGEMAAWLVLHRVRSVRALRGFDGAGYRYDADRSTPDEPTFVRT
ncbi:peroxide stress protein YaaA [Rhodococcus aerolatus]